MIEIQATQRFIKDIFKQGNIVTPLQKYIFGTNEASYKNVLIPEMMEFPASKILTITSKRKGSYNIALESNNLLYTYSPAMFQEFWIYALFQEEYAKTIIEQLTIYQITCILDSIFSQPESGISILKEIAKGNCCNYTRLDKAFEFAYTPEGTNYWNSVSGSLLFVLHNKKPVMQTTQNDESVSKINIDKKTDIQEKESLKLPVLSDMNNGKYVRPTIKLILSNLNC